MENRDAIIAKLNALRAKANGASTPEEAMAFANGYEKLMAKYKLTETDLEVKSSKVGGMMKNPPKQFTLIERVCNRIATLTETVCVQNKATGGIAFLGLTVDLQYADWLYELILNSLERGYQMFPASATYHRLLNNKVKPQAIKENYKIGFLTAIAHALDVMIEANKVRGNALLVIKQDIILAFINENGGMKQGSSKALKLYDGAEEVAYEGFKDGSKVSLRQSVEEEKELLALTHKKG